MAPVFTWEKHCTFCRGNCRCCEQIAMGSYQVTQRLVWAIPFLLPFLRSPVTLKKTFRKTLLDLHSPHEWSIIRGFVWSGGVQPFRCESSLETLRACAQRRTNNFLSIWCHSIFSNLETCFRHRSHMRFEPINSNEEIQNLFSKNSAEFLLNVARSNCNDLTAHGIIWHPWHWPQGIWSANWNWTQHGSANSRLINWTMTKEVWCELYTVYFEVWAQKDTQPILWGTFFCAQDEKRVREAVANRKKYRRSVAKHNCDCGAKQRNGIQCKGYKVFNPVQCTSIHSTFIFWSFFHCQVLYIFHGFIWIRI